MNRSFFVLWAVVTVGLAAVVVLLLAVRPAVEATPVPAPTSFTEKHGDQQLAYLLVKLELRTRAVVYAHYTRPQSRVPGIDLVYRRWLAKNAILPAAVADRVFADVVPGATGGRAWVKMVVNEPRNPHNLPDATARGLFEEIRAGAKTVEKSMPEAYYYAEPIRTTEVCMPCHGEPRGKPDPIFPQYRLEGWRPGQVIGAVVARVAPESLPANSSAASASGR